MSGSGDGIPEQMWPWQELGTLADAVYENLKVQVREIMLQSGEDPDNAYLYRLRLVQTTFSINARAEKEGRS